MAKHETANLETTTLVIILLGGFNLSEKYARQHGNLPQGVNTTHI